MATTIVVGQERQRKAVSKLPGTRLRPGCPSGKTRLRGPELLQVGDDDVDGHGSTLLPGLIDAHVHLLPGSPIQALCFG